MPEIDSKVAVPQNGANQTKPTSTRAKWWMSELISLAVVLAAVTAARSSLADHYYVPSGSMEYTLMPGDRVVVNKMSYGLRIPLTKIDLFGSSTPERGEIAVFDSPEDGTTRLIKRIVAIGGDHVSVVDGQLSINGKALGDRTVEHFGERDAQLNLTSQPSYNRGGGPNFEAECPRAWCSRWATIAATATTAAGSASSARRSCSAVPSVSTTALLREGVARGRRGRSVALLRRNVIT